MKITLKDQSQTEQVAAILAAQCSAGDVIALHGDLGVGKSVFSRAFIQAICGAETDVPSPTFSLVQIYETEHVEIYHYDFYRLNHPDECLELGVEEAFYEGLCLVEWPSKIGAYLPWDCLNLHLVMDPQTPTARRLELSSKGNWMDRLDLKGFSHA